MQHERPQTLPEYANNPFIANLPLVQTRFEMLERLRRKPDFNVVERGYPAHLRKHCILRLSQYFEPLDRHIQFCEKFDMLLRQGYLSRNPLTHDYIHRLQSSHERKKQSNSGAGSLSVFESFASSFALIGTSGIGKSKTLACVLPHYKQIIEHTELFTLSQIVWIRLDCPSQGSLIQLCRTFFYTVDQLLGSNYQAKFAGKHHALDDMLLAMGHIANLHAIGALIIDEIQFLSNIKNGSDALLRFFVTLVNTIGIPVVLVGTNSALPLLQNNFKEARRANGLGSMIWDPIENNGTWQHLVKELWNYQWVKDFTDITDEIIDVLHEESQGIVDILIKLFMLVQLRIISVREARPGPETITPALIRKVAKEDFRMVRPMLDALKKRDMKSLQRYDDLLPFQTHFDTLLHQAMETQSVIAHIPKAPASLLDRQDNVGDQLLASLKLGGYAEDIAKLLIDQAMKIHPSGDFILLMSEVIRSIQSPTIKQKKLKVIRQVIEEMTPSDLRYIVEKSEGDSIYQKLLLGGAIRSPLQDVRA